MIWLSIDRKSKKTITKQIFDQIKSKVINSELKSGFKLPSTRELSISLKVSRNIIIEVYELLLIEGFVESRKGSGTYVAKGASITKENPEMSLDFKNYNYKNSKLDNVIDFNSGIPALDLFPLVKWNKTYNNALFNAQTKDFGYENIDGRPELKLTISNYLKKTRGIVCSPEQIIITSGATQAISIIAQYFSTINNEIWMEDPTTLKGYKMFSSIIKNFVPVPVDEEGVIVSDFQSGRNPSCIFVTPSHQFPLGGILSIQRRIQLIEFARKENCYIIEDDYDNEFRYEGFPISSLHELDPERVIYIGSFSKILIPALRIGYLILPEPLIEKCREIKYLDGNHTNTLTQLALYQFIETGILEKHIYKMKKIYKRRRDVMASCLKESFGDQIKILGRNSGLHLAVEFIDVIFNLELINKIKENGVIIYPIEDFTIKKGLHLNQILLGYSHLDTEKIIEGIARLKKFLK